MSPFIFWSEQNLFQNDTAIGKSLKIDGNIKQVVRKCGSRHYAIVLVEVSTLDALHIIVLVSLDTSFRAVARIQVFYLNALDPCKACHLNSQDTPDCPFMARFLDTYIFKNRVQFGWFFRDPSQACGDYLCPLI